MSLLTRGDVKTKPRFQRQKMSLSELDINIDADYFLEDSDELGDDELSQAAGSSQTKPRGKDDVATCGMKMENEVTGVTQSCRLELLLSKDGEQSAPDGSVKDGGNSMASAECFQKENVPIDSTVQDVLKELEAVYVQDRCSVVLSESIFSTPLHALKTFGANIEETVRVENISYVKDDLPKRVSRVELFLGVIRGVGEAFNVNAAAQMAVIDVLMRAEEMGCRPYIDPYAIFPGWRIHPRVLQDLMKTCVKNGLPVPKYTTKLNCDPKKPTNLVECSVGNTVIGVGESDLDYVARKLAAAKAIECISGLKYPLEYVALGSACATFGELASLGFPILNMAKYRVKWIVSESNTMTRGVDSGELEAVMKEIYRRRKGNGVDP